MRSLRVGIAALIGVVVFLVPSAASAQVTDVSVAAVQLGPEGASVVVPVSVVCDVGYGIVAASVSVAQSTGHKLTTAGGQLFGFSAIPCTGGPQDITVTARIFSSPWAFKQGKATVDGNVVVTILEDTFPTWVFVPFGPITTRIVK